MKNNRTFLEKLLDGAEVEWKTLDEISSIYGGLTGKGKADFENGNALYVPYKNIFNNIEVDFNNLETVNVSDDEKQYTIKYGDVLFTGSSETAEEAGMSSAVTTKTEQKIYLNSFSFGLRFNDDVELLPEFSKFLFRTLSIRKEIVKSASGVTRFNISKARFKKIKIPIPPLPVQTEIVKILDALTALTSELTSELTLRRKQYEYYRETLLSPDNLEQLNTGGAKKKLSDVVNIYLGLTYTPTYVENGVKFISAQNTSNDFLDLSNTKFISREEFEKSTSNAKPKRGDILFTRVGSNLGHPVIVDTDEDLCIFVSLGFLRVKDKNILNSYIKHWMNTDLFWKQVEKNVHGSAKVNLNTGWLKNFEIYIPPLEEQQRIVSILDKFETLTNSITEGLPLAIEQSQKRYEYYRELLLNFS